MNNLLVWPERLPASLDGLYEAAAAGLGAPAWTALPSLDALELLPAEEDEPTSALIVIGAAPGAGAAEVIAGLEAIARHPSLNLAVVVGDGYLGTDTADLGGSLAAAAAVTAVRSLATRKDGSTRANVICVPIGLFESGTSQRGPIPQQVEAADLAAAAVYLLGEAGAYLNGQVLYVNGGRQLFSSHTA